MPKLRHIISGWLARRMVESAAQDPQTALLAGTVLEQQALIGRMKQAEIKRRALHRKSKQRLQDCKKETKQQREEAVLLRRELSQLKSVCAGQEQVLNRCRPFIPWSGGDGSGETNDILMAPRFRVGNERKAWKSHWMRLGVLHQHPPRPLNPPRIPKVGQPDSCPSIALVTPSWQQGAFLERTMKSVLDQRYPNLQYVVMDGGSTDGSAEIIAQHAGQLRHWQSAPDGGQAAAIADGFAKTDADIMGWLNSDDLLLPGSLTYVARYFARHPDVDCVYAHRVLINEAGHEVGRWFLPAHDPVMLLWADYIPQETWFWRRSIYERAGGLDSSFRFAMDWDLLLRMQRCGAVMRRLPAFTGAFRVHDAQKSQAEIHESGRKETGRIRDRELGVAFNQDELQRRCTAYQIRALHTMRLWHLGIRW